MSSVVARLALLALSFAASPASHGFVIQPGEVMAVTFTVTSIPDSPILQNYPYDTIALVIDGNDAPGATATIFDGSAPLGTVSPFTGSVFYWRTAGSVFSDDAGGTLSSVPAGVLASFPFIQGFTGFIEVQSLNSALTFDTADLRILLGRGAPGGMIVTEGGTLVTVDSFAVYTVSEPSTWALAIGVLLAMFALGRPSHAPGRV